MFSNAAVRNSDLALAIVGDDRRTFEAVGLNQLPVMRGLSAEPGYSSATDWSVWQAGLCQHKATNSPSSTSSTFPFLASSSSFCLRSVLLKFP